MPLQHVVVDGSNIATEGRTLPSLKQLNEAVLAFLRDYPEADVTVVVDASFAHRIDPSEVGEFEAAEANNELVSPPAGAIGRGDAFLLRIAGKIGATVLSNDSFQEFHGEHAWLFDEGRLIGGKPVPGIGWIFTPRTPVRGLKSRKAVKDAKGRDRTELLASGEELGPMPVPSKPPPRRRAKAETTTPAKARAKAETKAPTKARAKADKGDKPGKDDRAVLRAIAVATEESIDAAKPGRKRQRKKRAGRPAEPVNDPLPFITFIANHKLGAEVEGVVESFTSHGAFVLSSGARCYIPIVALGDPPPRAARDALRRGEVRTFVVQALDPQRRGIELALPEYAHVAGAPTPETIEAEIAAATVVDGKRRRRPAGQRIRELPTPQEAAHGRKVAAKKPTKAAARKVVGEQAPPAKKPPTTLSTTKKAGAKKSASAKKATSATKATSAKKATKASPTRKGSPTNKAPSPGKQVAKVKKAASAKKVASTRKAASAKKATSTRKAVPVTKGPRATKAARGSRRPQP